MDRGRSSLRKTRYTSMDVNPANAHGSSKGSNQVALIAFFEPALPKPVVKINRVRQARKCSFRPKRGKLSGTDSVVGNEMRYADRGALTNQLCVILNRNARVTVLPALRHIIEHPRGDDRVLHVEQQDHEIVQAQIGNALAHFKLADNDRGQMHHDAGADEPLRVFLCQLMMRTAHRTQADQKTCVYQNRVQSAPRRECDVSMQRDLRHPSTPAPRSPSAVSRQPRELLLIKLRLIVTEFDQLGVDQLAGCQVHGGT